MKAEPELLEEAAADLFEDAPCGYVLTRPDGTIVKVNRTFESWTGYSRGQLVAARRFQDMLAPGGRIYYETHFAPLLHMQGAVREIAIELVRADGSRLPALVNATLGRDEAGRPRVVRATVFDATDRRRYEDELLRARRREEETADALQRGLLAGTLPTAPGLELEVAYRPGVSGLAVGGDWYDAFWLREGEAVGLVVGDVAGRGIGAAATMGQLRSALRALASTGLAPARLLAALDGYVRRHGVGPATTLVYAELELAPPRLRFACAGHPPPLLAIPGQAPFFAWEGRTAPLDFHLDARPLAEASQALTPGSTVVLYSDGLVERRFEPLDAGLERLRETVAAHDHASAAQLLDAIVAAHHNPDHADDVCLLVARITARSPAPPSRRPSGDPGRSETVVPLRRAGGS